jgi:type I restriction enzyme S subunit
MTDWKEYKLGEIVHIIGGGTPKTSEPKYWNGNIPWLSVVDFNNGNKYVNDTEKHITQEGLENSSTRLLKKGDIIISARGTVGAIAMLVKEMAFNQSCYGVRNSELIDNHYLFYLLKNSINELKQNSHGGVFDTITRETFNSIDISLPSLSEQKRIASILSSLDDKIDLLHRENKTLEAMAETLFRQWFVEEAKEDWKEVSLTKVANFLNGLACQKYPPKNEIEKLPVLKIRELSNGIGKDCDWATTDIANEYIVSNGDVIFAWSASLMVKIWDGEECVLNQHLFKVTSDKYPKWFYYFWCKYHLDEFITIAQSHATTMGHIKRKDLENAMVLVPTDNELKTMSKQIESLLQKIENNNNEIKTLTQTRDSLLPKLMSGEIKV